MNDNTAVLAWRVLATISVITLAALSTQFAWLLYLIFA